MPKSSKRQPRREPATARQFGQTFSAWEVAAMRQSGTSGMTGRQSELNRLGTKSRAREMHNDQAPLLSRLPATWQGVPNRLPRMLCPWSSWAFALSATVRFTSTFRSPGLRQVIFRSQDARLGGSGASLGSLLWGGDRASGSQRTFTSILDVGVNVPLVLRQQQLACGVYLFKYRISGHRSGPPAMSRDCTSEPHRRAIAWLGPATRRLRDRCSAMPTHDSRLRFRCRPYPCHHSTATNNEN